MSARPHGPTRAGAWRGGCHSERSAIAAVTDPAMLVQAWCVAVPIGKRISIVAQLIVSTSVWSLASAHYTVVASVTRIGPRTSTAVFLGAHTCTGSDCGPGHLQLARIAQVQREPTASSHGGTVCHRPLISAPLSRLQAVSAGKLLRLAHLATINHRLGTRFCRGSLFDRRLWSIASSGVCDEDQLDRTFSKSPGQSACSTAKHLWKRSRSQQSPPG